MHRDEALLSLRPKIKLDDQDSLPLEAFQNNTLRPILKLQHPLSLAVVQVDPHFAGLAQKLADPNQQKQADAVAHFLRSNANLRNKLIGMMVGMMTLTEFEEYETNMRDYNKRIISMQAKRIVDTFQTL